MATNAAQQAKLLEIQALAARNGVADLHLLTAHQVRALWPELHAVAALLRPSTGIIDSHGLMLALQGDLERAGGALALLAPLESIDVRGPMPVLSVGGDAPMQLSARVVVNAAGLWAPHLAAATLGMAPQNVPQAHYAKGNYFSLSVPAPFSRLIHPVPQDAGLGVHLTLDLAGQARFGPDVEWVAPAKPDAIDYRVDASRAAAFDADIRSFWPALPGGALQPAYSGVRPNLLGPGQPASDFVLQGPADHGIAGLMNLFGIESPGLTPSLAIADEVLRRLGVQAVR